MINAYGAVKANLQDGSLRAIVTTAATRAAALPDVPTVSESGIANFEISSWNGLFAPAHTLPAAVERLSRELVLALRRTRAGPAIPGAWRRSASVAAAHVAARMRTEIERWSRVIEDAGIERQ